MKATAAPSLARSHIIILVLAPLLAAGLTWFGVAGLPPQSVRATANVDIAPLIGTYSSFEIATHASNFAMLYGSDRSLGNGESEGTAPGPFVDSEQLGSSTVVTVSYVADTPEEASSKLRDRTADALGVVADGIEAQRARGVRGSRRALDELVREAQETPGASPSTATTDRAGELLADAVAGLETIRDAQARIDERVDGLDVSTELVSVTSQRIRIAAIAALSAFLIAGAVVYRLRRGPGPAPRDRAATTTGSP